MIKCPWCEHETDESNMFIEEMLDQEHRLSTHPEKYPAYHLEQDPSKRKMPHPHPEHPYQ